MRIGVLSDTHIPERASVLPAKMLEDFKGADMVIHAGDLVDLEVLEQLKTVCSDIRGVWGNMDPYEVRQKLPDKQIITAGKFKIGVAHGTGAPHGLLEQMKTAFQGDKVDVVIFGHSHTPLITKQGDCLYFNPGSVTDDLFAPYRSYGILEINDTIEAKIVKI